MHTSTARSRNQHQLQLALHLQQTDSRRLAYVFECVNEESLESPTFVGGGRGGGSVHSAPVLKTRDDETALLQNLKMIRDGLAAKLKRALQFGHSHRPGLEQFEQP